MHDFATFGEMLLSGIAEANRRFEEMQSEMRFLSNIDGGEDVYDVYMAKKKSGKPKDGEPSKFFCYKVACCFYCINLLCALLLIENKREICCLKSMPELNWKLSKA